MGANIVAIGGALVLGILLGGGLVVLVASLFGPSVLPDLFHRYLAPPMIPDPISLEKIIRQHLKKCGGNLVRTARSLGTSLSVLRAHCVALGIDWNRYLPTEKRGPRVPV